MVCSLFFLCTVLTRTATEGEELEYLKQNKTLSEGINCKFRPCNNYKYLYKIFHLMISGLNSVSRSPHPPIHPPDKQPSNHPLNNHSPSEHLTNHSINKREKHSRIFFSLSINIYIIKHYVTATQVQRCLTFVSQMPTLRRGGRGGRGEREGDVTRRGRA